jgi:hypothetical protein
MTIVRTGLFALLSNCAWGVLRVPDDTTVPIRRLTVLDADPLQDKHSLQEGS